MTRPARRRVALLAMLPVAAAVGCAPQQTGARSDDRPSIERSPERPVPTVEYAELRWELGPGTRRVTFERPGERVYGAYFGDVLDALDLPRPEPARTQTPTSTDLLTMLSADGWSLVTHTAGTDPADLRGGNASPDVAPAGATAPPGDPAPASVHTEVWTLRRTVQR